MAAKFPTNAFVPAKIGSGKRLVVAEAPGENEALQGEPLVGTAGKWFDAMLRKARVNRDELTLLNVINCHPPQNIFPTDPEAKSYISAADGEASVQHCLKAHVWPLLKGREWARVDLLGEKALRYIAGKQGGIFQWRGSPMAIPELGDKPIAIPTIHPAAIARDQSLIPVVINDLKKATILAPEDYQILPSLDDVRAFTATEFAFDIECSMATREITLVGLSSKLGKAIVIPFRGAYKAELKRIFKDATVLYAHNGIAFDVPILFKELELEWKPD